MAAPKACHCEHCRDQFLAGWYDGYSTATFEAAHSVVKSGMFEVQDTAQKLIAEAHLVTHPEPKVVAVERWHE